MAPPYRTGRSAAPVGDAEPETRRGRRASPALGRRYVKAGELDGYVWGVNWHELYPGITLLDDSAEAPEWSERLDCPFTRQVCLGEGVGGVGHHHVPDLFVIDPGLVQAFEDDSR